MLDSFSAGSIGRRIASKKGLDRAAAAGPSVRAPFDFSAVYFLSRKEVNRDREIRSFQSAGGRHLLFTF